MAKKTPLSHDALVRALRETPASPWPDCDDRAAWERIAATPHGAAIRDTALKDARRFLEQPAVLPSLTDFLAFTRTGDREPFQNRWGALNSRLDAFALAACFTGDPAWADHAADALWAICEMTTWVWPAHEGAAMPDPDYPNIDLAAAMEAQQIAEALQIVGPALDRIDPRIRRRALRELDNRIFTPFLARADFWWLWLHDRRALNNWTAVCSGGVLLAALGALGHDPERQARVVAKAAWSLGFFRDTFGAAGSLDEGAGYWAYGVSYYVMAAERLATRTGGAFDLLADPDWREIAQFPLRVRLYGDTFGNFSDCAPQVRPEPGWLAWLGRRMDLPPMQNWAARIGAENAGYGSRNRHLPYVLRNLFWMDSEPPTGTAASPSPAAEPITAYLPDVEWLIARTGAEDDALILAVKGGHNDESHNHNDGGSFIVHYRQEPLIDEIGAPTYTRQFFSAVRYENIAARSLGHPVPYPNETEQVAGYERAARVLAQGDGRLSLELSGFYPEAAKLASLRRDIALHAGGEGRITLSDHAVFTEDGSTLTLPLIARDCTVEALEPGRARITGKRGRLDIAWDPAQAVCRAEPISTDDPRLNDSAGNTRLHRLWFDITVVGKEGQLDLTMTPEEIA